MNTNNSFTNYFAVTLVCFGFFFTLEANTLPQIHRRYNRTKKIIVYLHLLPVSSHSCEIRSPLTLKRSSSQLKIVGPTCEKSKRQVFSTFSWGNFSKSRSRICQKEHCRAKVGVYSCEYEKVYSPISVYSLWCYLPHEPLHRCKLSVHSIGDLRKLITY